jgi:hypothetical protein
MGFSSLASCAGFRLTSRTSSNEAAIGLRQIDDARVRALRGECAVEPLDEPRAECVQPLEFFQIDVDAARLLVAAGRGIDHLLKLGGALGRPCAGCCQGHAFPVDRAGQRSVAQSGALPGGAQASRGS